MHGYCISLRLSSHLVSEQVVDVEYVLEDLIFLFLGPNVNHSVTCCYQSLDCANAVKYLLVFIMSIKCM